MLIISYRTILPQLREDTGESETAVRSNARLRWQRWNDGKVKNKEKQLLMKAGGPTSSGGPETALKKHCGKSVPIKETYNLTISKYCSLITGFYISPLSCLGSIVFLKSTLEITKQSYISPGVFKASYWSLTSSWCTNPTLFNVLSLLITPIK